MRHFLVVGTLAGRMCEATVAAGLIAPPRFAQGLSSGSAAAIARAVSIAAVAGPADEEHLPAIGSITNDEAKRVHVPGAPAPENWTDPRGTCDDDLVGHVPVNRHEGLGGRNSGSLLPPGVGCFSLPRSGQLREFFARQRPEGRGLPAGVLWRGNHRRWRLEARAPRSYGSTGSFQPSSGRSPGTGDPGGNGTLSDRWRHLGGIISGDKLGRIIHLIVARVPETLSAKNGLSCLHARVVVKDVRRCPADGVANDAADTCIETAHAAGGGPFT